MKDDKLLNLFETMKLLSRPNGASPCEVTKELGFDRHTFYQMIKTLDAINVPYEKRPDYSGPTNSIRYFIQPEFFYTDGPKILRLSKSEFFILKYLLRKDVLFHQSPMTPVIDSLKQKLNKLTFSDTTGSLPAIFVTDNHRRNYNQIQQNTFSSIMEAIENKCEFSATYTSSPDFYNKRERKELILQPFTFLDHNGAFYVLAKNPKYESDNIRTYSLDRFEQVKLIKNNRFTIPEDFSPEEYLKGAFGLRKDGNPERIKLLFQWYTWTAITDRIWGENQKLEKQEDGSFLLEFDSYTGVELESWIRSFGCGVKVLGPESLQDKIKDDLQKALEVYK